MLTLAKGLLSRRMTQAVRTPFLVALDFDQTIVDSDSTSHVLDKLRPELKSFVQDNWDMPWPDLNDTLFQKMKESDGVAKEQVLDAIRSFSFNQDMLRLFKMIKIKGGDIAIISDANAFFVEQFLSSKNALGLISHLATNPAFWNEEIGRLQVSRRMRDTSHGCQRGCPPNLCKGHEVSALRKQYDFVMFGGDGQRDYCGMIGLGPRDVALARRGFGLEKYLLSELETGRVGLQARLVWWNHATDLIDRVEEELVVRGY
ncbi:phosphatase phospho-type [Chytriomyces sp. MP71]|nr:phosphatase phospho-type [Chytriomyces sp. MP71]